MLMAVFSQTLEQVLAACDPLHLLPYQLMVGQRACDNWTLLHCAHRCRVCKVHSVCRFVTDAEAIAQALQQAWPLLEKGFTQHKGNVRAVERYARCPRYALRSSGLCPQAVLGMPGTLLAA